MSNSNPTYKFPKGQVQNPKGRPKGSKSIADLLRQFGKLRAPAHLIADMEEAFPQLKKRQITVHEAIYARMCYEAMKGDTFAVDFVANRTEGKVTDKVQQVGPAVINLNWSETNNEPDGN